MTAGALPGMSCLADQQLRILVMSWQLWVWHTPAGASLAVHSEWSACADEGVNVVDRGSADHAWYWRGQVGRRS